MSKKKFFVQGIILTAVSFFLRVTNIGYRSYLSQKIGQEGMGLYQLIFSIFMLTVTLSTSGISLAVTRMVSNAIISKKSSSIRSIVSKCFAFCLSISITISAILFFSADFAAKTFLGNESAANCLRILGVGLPFMSICTCLKGYFLAVDESLYTALSDGLEQILSIVATVVLFWYFAPKSIETACFMAMLASTIGEITSFISGWTAYRRSLKRNTPEEKSKSSGVMYGMTHIALPCTLSSAARSLLNTGENLLIPKQLQKFGLSYSVAMSQYGLLGAMAIPMLYFPSSFLTSFASLLVPKISNAREQNHKKEVSHIAGKAISSALIYGIFFAAIFVAFGDVWGIAFYNDTTAGSYLKVLAPIVPLIYLDVVVDNLLKGMDEQFNSMKFNFADSLLRVILVICIMPFLGMESYVGIIVFSSIFNASLSLGRLLKVTNVRLYPLRQIILPSLAAILSVVLTSWLLSNIYTETGLLLVILQVAVSALIFCILLKLISIAFDINVMPLSISRAK